MKVDKETNKVVSQTQTVYDFVKSDGFKIFQDKLRERIINLRDIRNIDKKQSKEKIAVDVIAFEKASDELYSLLSELIGTAQAHQYMQEMSAVQDDIIFQVEENSL